MNVTGVLLALIACLAFLTRSVFSSPFVQDVDQNIRGRVHPAEDLASIHRERRDATAEEGGETLLSRLRRQVAQMAASSRTTSGSQRGRRWRRTRLMARRRYQRERASRGNVANW